MKKVDQWVECGGSVGREWRELRESVGERVGRVRGEWRRVWGESRALEYLEKLECDQVTIRGADHNEHPEKQNKTHKGFMLIYS